MGICISITENIVQHGRHFFPVEKFPPSGNRISLWWKFFPREENAGRVGNICSRDWGDVIELGCFRILEVR